VSSGKNVSDSPHGAAPDAAQPSAPNIGRKPVQQCSADTCRRIEEAASRLLASGAVPDALTTFQVAKEAGVSVGALYRFFPDNQAIVDAC